MTDSATTFPIAYVAGQFPLRSETFVWREVRELRRRGWKVHTFGLRKPDEQTPSELADLAEQTQNVYDFAPTRPSFTWDMLSPGEPMSITSRLKLGVQNTAGLALAGKLRDAGVRHVHAHFAHAPATVAMYAARWLGIPFSFTGHANDLFQRRHLLKRKLQRASFVACISDWHRDLYQSVAPGGNYQIVRCGVPMAEFDARPSPTGALKVLAVARLVEKKGLDRLIEAAGQVEGVEITIAGDGPERAKLEAMAGAETTFLGAVDASAVPGLLAAHHAFALPCQEASSGDRDGIPVALMEAMAAGRVVVAGDLPAIKELITDAKTGRLVPYADHDEAVARLVDVLRSWQQSPVEREALATAGRAWAGEEFSLSRNVDRLERAIIAGQSRV